MHDQLLNKAVAAYRLRYKREPQYAVTAPGRVNLIGEHTDYNDGFVFPMAIGRSTVIVAGQIPGKIAEVYSMSTNQSASIRCEEPILPEENVTWASYVQGTIACCLEKGIAIPGFQAVINSNVPLGGGLSSSASLEVAVATLVEAMTDYTITLIDKALLCQKAEHEFAKMPCGIMDQFISVLAQKNHAMLLDCRSRIPTMVPLNDPAIVVLVTNSNVRHELTGSEYPQRRYACEKAANILGVPKLRDADMHVLEANRRRMDDSVFYRARHVIGENARTRAMAEALVEADWDQVGRLMFESHDSLKNDYEVSCPEIDILVEIARQADSDFGVIGSRITGGGFGGCTVSLIRADRASCFSNYLATEYTRQTNIVPALFTTRPAQGAQNLF